MQRRKPGSNMDCPQVGVAWGQSPSTVQRTYLPVPVQVAVHSVCVGAVAEALVVSQHTWPPVQSAGPPQPMGTVPWAQLAWHS